MKKETTISVKATLSKPKVSEKKASAKEVAKADDVCADTPTEVTNQQNDMPFFSLPLSDAQVSARATRSVTSCSRSLTTMQGKRLSLARS